MSNNILDQYKIEMDNDIKKKFESVENYIYYQYKNILCKYNDKNPIKDINSYVNTKFESEISELKKSKKYQDMNTIYINIINIIAKDIDYYVDYCIKFF